MAADVDIPFFVLASDANGDERVNLRDFNILAANFGELNRPFSQGDFNYDGLVNLQDFNLLASRFGQAIAVPADWNDDERDGTDGGENSVASA